MPIVKGCKFFHLMQPCTDNFIMSTRTVILTLLTYFVFQTCARGYSVAELTAA